ncbi:MAG TPA: hypothetical protein PLD82_08425 [Spirochaetota bacterium]|nr:hypothetical protein [Spirochaetota bacterium]
MFATKLKEHEETMISKGKIEGKIEAARQMLAEGLNEDLVSKCTGLSRSDIESLRNKNN